MDLETAPSSGISTAISETRSFASGLADYAATKLAKLQKSGKPWPCPKLKREVTNFECIHMHTKKANPYCRDCGVPSILKDFRATYQAPSTAPNPKPKEAPKVAKHKHTCPECGEGCNALFGRLKTCYGCFSDKKPAPAPAKAPEPIPVPVEVDPAPAPDHFAQVDEKVDPAPVVAPRTKEAASEPAWEDFSPIDAPARPGSLYLSCQSSNGKFALSKELGDACGLKCGDFVLVRLRNLCTAAGVPFFLKQMTKKGSIPEDLLIREVPSD